MSIRAQFLAFIALALLGLSMPSSAFAQESAEDTAKQALENGRFADALDAAHRNQTDTNNSPDSILLEVEILIAMDKRQAALSVLDEHAEAIDGVPRAAELRAKASSPATTQRTTSVPAVDQDIADQRSESVLGWALIGGGTFLAVAGVVSFIIADIEADRIRCSVVSNADKEGCSGDAYGAMSRTDFEEKTSVVSTTRIIGATMLVAGVGLATWGVIKLQGPEVGDVPTTFKFAPASDGAQVFWGGRF